MRSPKSLMGEIATEAAESLAEGRMGDELNLPPDPDEHPLDEHLGSISEMALALYAKFGMVADAQCLAKAHEAIQRHVIAVESERGQLAARVAELTDELYREGCRCAAVASEVEVLKSDIRIREARVSELQKQLEYQQFDSRIVPKSALERMIQQRDALAAALDGVKKLRIDILEHCYCEPPGFGECQYCQIRAALELLKEGKNVPA